MKEVRLILGDQLNQNHSWFQETRDDVLYVMMEMRQETDYVCHHIQKVVAFFKSMRWFANVLQSKGHQLKYYTLDDPDNQQSIEGNLQQVFQEVEATSWAYQLPDEYRLDQMLQALSKKWDLSCTVADTEHFYTQREEVQELFEGKKTYLMERFYRVMRKKHDVLMDDGAPIGGDWNYDQQNRKKLPKDVVVPEPFAPKHDVTALVKMIEAAGVDTMGEIQSESFAWMCSLEEGKQALAYFLKHLLPQFGDYQDAMTTQSTTLFHSRLSFLMNAKIMSPQYVVDTAESYYRAHEDEIDISQIEGFIRQILGWREYMRGLYWAKMPEYGEMNFFGHDRKLPDFYWTGQTKMKCLQHSIGQSLEEAYAHHIQRLMVCGNFALMAGVHPDEVDAWYLGVYIDAIEWVELPNTRGMSQFADGGIVATKPYCGSANYMKKMGDYCKQCVYKASQKTGEGACPFNSLYWHFIARNESLLRNNPRMGMMYRVWNKYSSKQQEEILDQADQYLENIDEL